MMFPAGAQVVHEDGAWAIFILGLPLAAEALTVDEAVSDMVEALREYAVDWVECLSETPNHRDNWGLVQFVTLSTDEQLTSWLVGE